MKFGRSGSVSLTQTGPEHLSWQSKLVLEHRSHLVSLERSILNGLVAADKVQSMLQEADWLRTESFVKSRDRLNEGVQGGRKTEEPFGRFPRVIEGSPVKAFRRGYDAPWTKSQFEMKHYVERTDNRSPQQIRKERTVNIGNARLAVILQQSKVSRLAQAKHSPTSSLSPIRTRPSLSPHSKSPSKSVPFPKIPK